MSNNTNGYKGQESDISTKKGFLISLPGKKQSSPTSSSINMAKTEKTAGAETDRSVHDNSGARNSNEKNNRHGGKKNFGKNKQNQQNRQNRQSNGSDNVSEAQKSAHQDRKQHDKGGKFKDRRDAKNKERNADNRPSSMPEKANAEKKNGYEDKGGYKKHDKGAKHKDRRNDRRNDRPEEKNGTDTKAARNNQVSEKAYDKNSPKSRDRHDGRRDDRREMPRTPALSALSSDIAAYSREKAKLGAASVTENVTELSLEEKYRNAKPLAVQIAEQEMKAKGIKIPEENAEEASSEDKQEIVGIRFKEAGKIYYFDPDGKNIDFGTPVVVETARGSEYGFVAISNRVIPVEKLSAPLKKIERIATQADTQKHVANKELEKDAEVIFKEKVEKLGLEMNLICVEYTFDNSRLLFYFTAESRVDFRELVKELAGVFRTRIELRQVGDRDEAKIVGGLGICGRAACCNTFLGEFAQISIKMAKDQSLSLNAAKISGTCGKLMCCLRYEDAVYEIEGQKTPRIGSIVDTPEGRGHVTDRHVLTGIVGVKLDAEPDAPSKPFSRDEVTVIGFDRDKGEKDDGDIPEDLKDSE